MANRSRTAVPKGARLTAPQRLLHLCLFVAVASDNTVSSHATVVVEGTVSIDDTIEIDASTDNTVTDTPIEVIEQNEPTTIGTSTEPMDTPTMNKKRNLGEKEETDWKDHMLDCFTDMKYADKNADNSLTEQEYFDFCNRYGNRIFVTQNIVAKHKFWQIEELYEEMVLENPFGDGKTSGVSIYGARIISRDGLDEVGSGTKFLQKVCNLSERTLRKVGPKQAVADRAKQKCDLTRTFNITTKPPQEKNQQEQQEEVVDDDNEVNTSDGYYTNNSTEFDEDLETMEGTVEGNQTLILETFHDMDSNDSESWVHEEFENGSTIEQWSNETAELMDDDATYVYESPVLDLMDSISGLFGFGGGEGEDEEAEEDEGEERHLRYVQMKSRQAIIDDEDQPVDEDFVFG